MSQEQPRNPLHGVTLKAVLEVLVERHGWPAMADRVHIRCFSLQPSIQSSLRFLRKNEWARKKVERMYLDDVRKVERNRKRKQRRQQKAAHDEAGAAGAVAAAAAVDAVAVAMTTAVAGAAAGPVVAALAAAASTAPVQAAAATPPAAKTDGATESPSDEDTDPAGM